MALTPTARLTVDNPDPVSANQTILTFLKDLAAAGERPWCEVRYAAPDHITDAAARDAWLADQEQTFDVVELVDGQLTTAPSYAEMETWT